MYTLQISVQMVFNSCVKLFLFDTIKDLLVQHVTMPVHMYSVFGVLCIPTFLMLIYIYICLCVHPYWWAARCVEIIDKAFKLKPRTVDSRGQSHNLEQRMHCKLNL